MQLPWLTFVSALLQASSNFASPLAFGQEQITLAAYDPFAGKVSWKDCGLEKLPVRIQSLQVTPDPPKPGQNMTVKVIAETSKIIEEETYADVTVKMGLVVLLKKTLDVCDEARDNNATIQCPVQPGKYTIEETVALPKEIPRVKFNVAVKGYSPGDEPLMCLTIDVDFMLGFPRLTEVQ